MPDSTAAAWLPAAPVADPLLRTVLDVSLSPIGLLRPLYAAGGGELVDFGFDYLNPAAQRLTGLTEQPGGSLKTHFPAAFAADVFAFCQRVFETGEPGQHEFHHQPDGSDGSDGVVRVAARRHGEQLVASFTGPASAPRPAAEQALHASEAREQATHAATEAQRQRLYAILEQFPAVVASYRGPQHVFELVSHRFQQDFPGRPIKGMPVREALPELQGQQYYEILDGVYRTGQPFYGTELETWVDRTATGVLERQFYNVFFQATRDAQGTVDGIINFAYDVTAGVLARQQVQQLNEELELRVTARSAEARAALHEAEHQREQARGQHAMLGQILGQVPAAIATLAGPEHRYSFFNDAYQALAAGRGVLGRPVAEALPEMVEQGFIARLDRVYATGQPFIGTEMPLLLLDPAAGQAGQRYIDVRYQPLVDGQQRTQGILAFVLDVTDKVRARRQVLALNEELQATNRALHGTNQRLTRTNADLDTFVYTASHDLKAPIANIEGLLHALRHDLPPAVMQDALVPRLLDLMQDSVVRFQQTIGHLTDISQLQQAEATETVDLAALVRGVQLDLAPLIEAAAATLTVRVGGCENVRMAPKTLRSVVYNLLSNAVKYRAPGRPAQVQLRAHCPPGQLVLEVQDNGLGLTAAQQGQLFGMFRRLHTHVEGSGVGLFMVKRLIENADGTIAVRSQLDAGTTFTVTLPA